MNILEVQRNILNECAIEAFSEDFGNAHHREEPHGITYQRLFNELGITRDRLRPEMIELRNLGYIELMPVVDCDGMPSGSGYFLTEKGKGFCIGIFKIKFDSYGT